MNKKIERVLSVVLILKLVLINKTKSNYQSHVRTGHLLPNKLIHNTLEGSIDCFMCLLAVSVLEWMTQSVSKG